MSDRPANAEAAVQPERMVTLTCPHCREALYMSTKTLAMPSWTCPSCKAVTRP